MGGEGSPRLPWGPSRSGGGPRADPLWSAATLCLPNAVTVSPSHLSGRQQPRSQYLQVIHRADPPHPASSRLWDLVASLGVGLGGGSPQVRPFPLYLPLPRPLGLVLKYSSPPPLPNVGQGHGGWSHHDEGEGAALLLLPPSYKVGFKLGRMGPHTGLPQEEGFWARVCKAIFLCGGKGRRE